MTSHVIALFCRAALFPRIIVLATMVGLALVAPVRAEKADRTKPIDWSADAGDVNAQTKAGTLTGNVIITQGTLTIHADKVLFHQNPDSSLSATAFGNPVTFRQKRDDVDEYYEGFAQRGEYDGTKQLLQLYDRALLRRSGDEIRSNYISYNLATDLFKAEGRPNAAGVTDAQGPGARVRGVFQPKQEPGKSEPGKSSGKAAAPAVPLKPAEKLGGTGK